MKFIKLTGWHDEKTFPRWINPEHITMLDDSTLGTHLCIKHSFSTYVTETPEQIIALIRESESTSTTD